MVSLISRRTMLISGLTAAVAAPAAALLYAWGIEPHWLEITTPELPIEGLPASLEGATLAQLSDLHIGPRVSDAYIDRVFQRVAAARPDIVVCTGDWITHAGDAELRQLAGHLDRVPRGRLGTFGILGNHDYGYGWRMGAIADRLVELAARGGIRILRNEAVDVAGLRIIGLDDLWGPNFPRRTELDRPLMDHLGAGPASLVLCHNPDTADQPVWGSYRGWILAGHTHGGQCKPPFLPPPILPVDNRRYTAGVIPVNQDRTLYISRGVGHLYRVRFNVRPEVPIFRLRSA